MSVGREWLHKRSIRLPGASVKRVFHVKQTYRKGRTMNLELTREEASAVVAAIHALMDELLLASMSNTINARETRLYRVLGDVARGFHEVESFYD